MSNVTLAIGRPTLADRLFARSLVADMALIIAGAGLTALLAQVAVPLWPVPVTGQTLAVLLVGSTLGALRGALSMTLYALLGIVGLPVFSEASSGWGIVSGPTGGYIVGFIFAAALTGWIAQREWDHKILRAFLSFVAGSLVTFAIGLPWLSYVLGVYGYPNDLNATLVAGFYPFILGGIIKALLAAGIITGTWALVSRADRKNAAQ